MKNFLKSHWKTLVFFTLAGIIGGFCCGLYLLDSYPPDIVQQITDQGFTPFLAGLVSAYQAAGYGLVLGALGIVLAKKTGLWKDETKIENKPLLAAIVIAIIDGVGIILPDLLYFGNYIPAVRESYLAKPTAVFILGAVIYGGVIEEVMLRLFLMSLIVFLLHKIFGKDKETPAVWMLVTANIIAALLFAAGHLPTTYMLMGITPMILIRCFLLNGTFGLLFGWLYRKYGLRYAMISHAGCHVISKLIWILFI